MELLAWAIDLVLHLDRHLAWLVQNYGEWIYAILFLVIYCETGLVVTPFLPGDSLLFMAGALAATGGMDVQILIAMLVLAAFAGDNTNYWIGRLAGPKLFRSDKSRFFNRAHLDKTHAFYERYGGKTVVFARFMPIVRTFAPFVAGIGRMTYARFLGFSAFGAVFWIGFFVIGGYLFGNLPVVKQNLSLVILAIIVISFMPGVIEYLKARRRSA